MSNENLSTDQASSLEEHYKLTPSPSPHECADMALVLDMPLQKVHEWFERKRNLEAFTKKLPVTGAKVQVPVRRFRVVMSSQPVTADSPSASPDSDDSIHSQEISTQSAPAVLLRPINNIPLSSEPSAPRDMKQSSVSPTEPDFADNLKKLVGDKTFLVPQISVVSFAKLMNSTTANEHRRWLLQILLNTKHNGILVQFAESKGLFVLDQWMRENADDQSPILIPILQLLKLLPITLQILTKPGLKLGKLVRNLCKTQAPSGSDEARKLANYLKAAWTKLTLIPAANAPSTVADAETLKRPHTAIDRPASKKPESIKTIPRKMAKTDSQPSAEIFDIFKTVESFKPDVVAKPLPKIQRNNSLPIALPIAKRKAEETPAAAEEKHVKISEQDEIKGPSYSRAISPPIEETVKPVEEAAVIPTAVSSITGKPKKRVQWKTNLTQIRFFESVETITNTAPGDPHASERGEFNIAAQRFRDTMEAANSWSTPVALKLPTEFVYGANSREIRIQEDRERGSLSATYFSEHDIPYSPAEPDNLDQIPIDDSQIPVIPLSNPALNATLSNSAPVIPPATIVSSPADAVAALQNLTPLAIASLMDQMSGRSSSPKIGITAPNSAPPLAFANDPNFQEKLRALSQGSRLEANAHYPASQNGARQGWQANQPMQHGGYMASPYGQPQMQYGQQVPALTNMPYSQQQQAPPQKSQWQMLPTGGPGQYQNQRPPRQHEPNFRNNSNNNVRPVTKGHGIPKNRINKPCLYFFRDGKCIHGDNCRYSHTNPN